MYKIILIISVSALLSFEVNRASAVPSDIRNDAKKSYDEPRQVASEGLNGAVTDGLSKITRKSEEYVSQLDSLKDLANSVGADIRICLAVEKQINELDDIISQDFIACVNNQAGVGINYLNGQIDSLIIGTWNQVYGEESPLVSCAATDENCFNLITKIQTNIPIVASKIKSSVDNERQTVEVHISNVDKCLDISMFTLEITGNSLITYVNTCVHVIIG